MRKVLTSLFVSVSLTVALTGSTPGLAGATTTRVARTSCATMGLTVASLRPQFGKVAITAASYECGLVGDTIEVTLYLYPASDRAAVGKEVALKPAHRLGGLGVGAIFANYGGGDFGLILTSGTPCVYIDGQELAP